MADGVIKRFVRAIFDRTAAQKMEAEFEQSLGDAGEKSGKAFLREMRAAFDKRMADLKVQLAKGLIDEKEFKKQSAAAAKAFNQGIVKGMEDARKAGNLTEKEYTKLSRTLKRVGDEGTSAWTRIKGGIVAAGGALAAFVGGRAILRFGQSAVREAAESENVWRSLAGTIAATGQSFEVMEAQVRSASKEFQRLTVHSDEDFARSLQRLIALTGNVSGSLRNMNLVADIAARFFAGDLAAATEAVAKGMNTGTVLINRMKFSLDDLAKRSFGAAAEAAGSFTGKLAQLNNEWGEFKEQLGEILVGGRDTAGVLDVLKASVIALAREVRTFLQLRGLVSLTAGTAGSPLATTEKGLEAQIKGFERQRVQLTREQGRLLKETERMERTIQALRDSDAIVTGKDLAQLTSLRNELQSANDELALVEANAAAAGRALNALRAPAGKPTDTPTDPKRGKELAAELERLNRDIAIRTLQLEQGITEANAREQVRREEILRGHVVRTVATIQEGFRLLDQLEGRIRAAGVLGLNERQPGLSSTETRPLDASGLPSAPGADMEGFAERQQAIAQLYGDTWVDALDRISDTAHNSMGLFDELSAAWAGAGIAGIVRLALAKIRENIAAAAEELAKAAGALASGNPAAAALHTKAAAAHKTAAVLWGVAGAAGAGAKLAGIGGGASGGVVGGSPGFRGQTVEPVKTENHIYFNGPKFTHPELQRQVRNMVNEAGRRDGNNAETIVHRGDN